MQIRKFSNKQKTVFALFLILALALPLTALSTAAAHTPAWSIVSFAYVAAAPNPTGVGQTAYVFCWVDTPITGAQVTNDIRRHDYKLVITDPDGVNTTQTWAVVSDTTGVQSYSFTPTKIGTYTLSFTYPGQTYTWTGANQGDWFQGASATAKMTVQKRPKYAQSHKAHLCQQSTGHDQSTAKTLTGT